MNSRRALRMILYIAKAFILIVLSMAIGCVSTSEKKAPLDSGYAQAENMHQDKPEYLRKYYVEIDQEGDKNFVLNAMRGGLAAMDAGDYDIAKELLDQVLLRIDMVYADNENAMKARSLWYEEGMKDFIGEPYERAMAFYYRGLLYMMDEDYENARACFKNGVIQDAFAEEEQNRCDFAALIFLEGWTSQMLGDIQLADAAYGEVQNLRPDFVRPNPEDNCLIIAETGKAPRKLADGVGHYELKLFRGKGFSDVAAAVTVAGQNTPMFAAEDVAWQAMTRGGRPIDHILKGKVVFKQTHEQAGEVMSRVGTNMMVFSSLAGSAGSGIQGAGAVLGLVGVAEMALSKKADARADTRYWDNLSDMIHVHTAKIAAGEDIEVLFHDKKGGLVSASRVDVQADMKGRSLCWVRSRQ